MMNIGARLGLLLSLFLTACGGSSGDARSTTTPEQSGTVLVVVETAAGSDDYVQFQLAGVALEDAVGATSDNLLPASTMLTVGDPTGEPVGLRLQTAPAAEYVALRLILAPGSGYAIAPDGTQRPVVGPLQVRIPITGGLRHTLQEQSWLVVGHDAVPLTEGNGTTSWNPTMSGRLDGATLRLSELKFPVANNNSVAATASAFDDASVELQTGPACIYEDELGQAYASEAAFVAALSIEDELECEGDLYRDGRLHTTLIRRSPRSDQPRLIGSVLSIDTASNSFEMQILATRRRGQQVNLATPETARILAGNAFFENEVGGPATIASLAIGGFVKVKWLNRATTGSLTTYTAREVELLGHNNFTIQPEWEGRVQSVDLANRLIVIVPRNNDPILIEGVAVPQAEVFVSTATLIERRANQGGNNTMIPLSQVQSLTDRIWVRGSISGPTLIEATRVRVRQD